jgi:hypothetical protein
MELYLLSLIRLVDVLLSVTVICLVLFVKMNYAELRQILYICFLFCVLCVFVLFCVLCVFVLFCVLCVFVLFLLLYIAVSHFCTSLQTAATGWKPNCSKYRGADKFLVRPGRKQATATEEFDFHISYLLS